MWNAGIAGIGSYVPEKVLTNSDLERMVDTSDEWIRTRTGISERHICSENMSTSDMAVEAAAMALKDAAVDAADDNCGLCDAGYALSRHSLFGSG